MLFERHNLIAALASVVLAGGLACGASPLTLPQPPQSLTALADAYANPTGTVNQAQLQQTVTDAEAQFSSSGLDWLPQLIDENLVRVRERFDQNVLPTNPLIARQQNRPSIQAVVNVQHVCQGWGSSAPAAGSNGDLSLTAVVEDTQLTRGVFGSATSCMETVQATNNVAVNAFVSGELNTLLQGSLPATDQDVFALVQISGQIGTQNNVTSGSVDFQIVGTQVEFRHTVSDGFVIVSIGPTSVSVRGSNGTFTCDLTGTTCSPSP
jgi:hypothetical protein